MNITVSEIAEISGGMIVGADSRAIVSGFDFDSRVQRSGAGFVALSDDRDGHDYVSAALEHGATVALVARIPEGVDGPLVVVEDPLRALGQIAKFARSSMVDTSVVAVAGSAGKTSTKDLIFSSVSRRFKSHANSASFNNEFGLPVTILDAPIGTEVLVLEMGERFLGDLSYLCDIAAPNIGVITHVGLAHSGNLGGRAGIIDVLTELLVALPNDGLAVLNSECSATQTLLERSAAPVLTVGYALDADVRISNASLDEQLRPTFSLHTPWGNLDSVRLQLLGEHQVANAAMAAATALYLGASTDDVALGLSSARAAHWRMELSHSPGGVAVLNDSYNASPKAMEAALTTFARLPAGRRMAVLGAMHELGDESRAEHARIGELAATLGIDEIVVVESELSEPLAAAAEASGARVARVANPEAAFALISESLKSGDAVLLKASRVVGLERVADLLLGAAG